MTREEQITLSIPEHYSDNDAVYYTRGAEWADNNPNLEEWFDKIHVWLMNNDKLREMFGISNQYELVTELRKFLNIKHYEK